MRTKTLLIAAAALVAGIISSNAQVYSANIVGYVNVKLNNGFTLVANPLDNGTNDLNSLFPNAGFGDTVYFYSGGTFSTSTYFGSWSPDLVITPGQGVFYSGGSVQTNTFSGQYVLGAHTNNIPVGFSIVSSKVPESDTLENLNFPAGFGDTVYFYRGGTYVSSTYFGSWSPDLSPAVGESFWDSTGTGGPWVQTY
jgi:hypothetical protein